MWKVETGLFANGVPYIRGGAGERIASVFFGVNALLRRLDRGSAPGRYAHQVSCLLPEHRFTILGYARSSFQEIVQDMAYAIPAPPDVVVGISVGGFIAMRFAAQHPELVKRLVLLVSAHRFSPSGWELVERQIQALERGDLETLVRENALLFRRPWYNWLVRVKLWKRGDSLMAEFRDPDTILRDYRQLFGPDFQRNAEYARRIHSPTLIIGGTADQLFDRSACEETASLIPHAEIRLFERETHMLPVEKSGEVARAIAAFLRRTDSSASTGLPVN